MADVKPLILDSGTIKQIATGDTLGVANGGTGATTLTDNGVLIGNGTGAVDVTAAGVAGEVLVGVTGGNPVFGAWLPRAIHKTATETVTSSAAVQPDDALTLPVTANATYLFVINGWVNSNSAGGWKAGLDYPTGATGYWNMMIGGSAYAGNIALASTNGSTSAQAQNLHITGYIVVSSTAGNLTLKWAQNASSVNSTTLSRGATMFLIRIS